MMNKYKNVVQCIVEKPLSGMIASRHFEYGEIIIVQASKLYSDLGAS